MFLYNVYLWLTLASEEAEVFQTRRAWCADQAISRVMHDRGVSYAYYAWAVPHNEKIPCTERYAVRCPGVPLVVH